MGAPARATAESLSSRVADLLPRVSYRRAVTDEDREAVFRLRYEAYLREGAIAPSFSRRLSDDYDDLDNAWIVGIYVDGELASSMRIHVATREYSELVAGKIFPEYVEPQIAAGKVIVDPTRFVVDSAAARAYPDIPYITVRTGHMAAEYFKADIVLATVRSEHQAFYKRVFGHVAVCPPRPYLSLLKPLSLMMLDYPATRDEIMRRYPFFRSEAAERLALFGPVPDFARRAAPTVQRLTGDAAALIG